MKLNPPNMTLTKGVSSRWLAAGLRLWVGLDLATGLVAGELGRETAIQRHLADGEEFGMPLPELVEAGRKLFIANWKLQEGAGRPQTKGTGAPLSDPSRSLEFPRNFNRISAPDANSCAGCHNSPEPGGNGDIVANVFVLAQRFDFATFNLVDPFPVCEAADERGEHVTQQTIGNSRATLGMFGSGYIEMLARQMTADLRAIRDSLPAGEVKPLISKGISFGMLARRPDGTWDTTRVEGLAAPSLMSESADSPPSLVVRPFHQAGNVVSLRQFSNNAFNHHHGMQSTERFGDGVDADGDGFRNELTRADLTAVTVFQATMAVPGRIISTDAEIEAAVLLGEMRFVAIGCARCHVPALPLEAGGSTYTEPNPYNPPGNLRPGETSTLSVDLSDPRLPAPRLEPGVDGVVWVPAFTDLKLHDITGGPGDPNREVMDMNQPAGSPAFFAGNGRFLTRKLWGAYGKPNFYHHGQYTTMREAILAHAGEALAERQAFEALPAHERDCLIEFLKTLQVLPPGTPSLVADEHGRPRVWPPVRFLSVQRSGNRVRLHWTRDSPLNPRPRRSQLQRAEDVTEGDWQDLGEPTTATEFLEAPAGGVGFYRLRVFTE